MIVQCKACQTRFRLADEKIKPGGTKVRCSKCKEVFTVTLPEPEPAEEAVEFDSFNMQKVTEDVPAESAAASASPQTATPEPEEQPGPPPLPEVDRTPAASEQPQSTELDFSALESASGRDADSGEELADHFSFADTSQPVADDFSEKEPASADADFTTGGESTDFGDAFEESEEPGGPVEFDFSDETESASQTADWAAAEASPVTSAEPPEFSFDSSPEESEEQEATGEFAFGDDNETTFSFDEVEEEASPALAQEYSAPGEFSFDDDESSVGDNSASAWDDTAAADKTSFDFEEPRFETDEATAKSSPSSSEDGELQFGEIDFSNESDENVAPSFQGDEDFSKATMPLQKEPESVSQIQHSDPPSRAYDDAPLSAPLPAPPPPKKSSLSRILVLLLLLLASLGGAAGYLFMQEGSLNLHTIARYLPFLQEYIGEAPVSAPGDRIGITIAGSSYVNGKAGQMLVIQGAAVNNHSTTRSAITVKGVLLDGNGQSLLQQTVFCGNKLDEAELKTMSFAAIEEAMNNQFGEGLSNMNVAAGATIPFTIVFRHLPAGIGNINVEVVDSKPGAG